MQEKKSNSPLLPEISSSLLCFGCGEVPSIRVSRADPLEIKFSCQKCKVEYVKAFSELLEEEKQKKKEKKERKPNEENKENVSNLKEEDSYSKKIKEAREYISNLQIFRKKYIKKLTSKEEAKQVDSVFQKYISVNSALLDFAQMLHNNYHQSDFISSYLIAVNMMNNTAFAYAKLKEDEPVEQVIDALKDKYILKEDAEEEKYPKLKFELKLKKELNLNLNIGLENLCLLKDGRIASTCEDEKMRIINLATGKIEITINNCHKCCRIIQLANENIVCNDEFKIYIYEITGKFYKLVSTFQAHERKINKIIFFNDKYFVSGSDDSTIKFWRAEYPYNLVKKLEGDGNIKSIIKLNKEEVVVSGSGEKNSYDKAAGGGDEKIKFWEFESEKPRFIIENVICYCHDSLVQVNDEMIISFGKKKVYSINVNTKQVVTVTCFRFFLYISPTAVKIDEENILLGKKYSFNINDGVETMILKKSFVEFDDIIFIEKNKMCSCSEQSTLQIWDLKKFS